MIDKQAFPVENNSFSEKGMTLRDYFAAKAMATLLQGAKLPEDYDAKNDFLMLSERSYEIAEAMMQAKIRNITKRGG